MIPTLKASPFSIGANNPTSSSAYPPMHQATSFIVWNTRGVNNENFACIFRELINIHNSCLIDLLETKLNNHLGLVRTFGFDNYWEIPTQGRSDGVVLLRNTNYVNVNCKQQTTQEHHAMIEVRPDDTPWVTYYYLC